MTNTNVGIQSPGVLAWDGLNAYAHSLVEYTNFGWVFEIVNTLIGPTVFTVQSAPPSAADPCVPGIFTDVDEIPTCSFVGTPGVATITLDAGTPAKTLCAATLVRIPDKFVRLVPVSGNTADVRAVLVRTGPKL